MYTTKIQYENCINKYFTTDNARVGGVRRGRGDSEAEGSWRVGAPGGRRPDDGTTVAAGHRRRPLPGGDG